MGFGLGLGAGVGFGVGFGLGFVFGLFVVLDVDIFSSTTINLFEYLLYTSNTKYSITMRSVSNQYHISPFVGFEMCLHNDTNAIMIYYTIQFAIGTA